MARHNPLLMIDFYKATHSMMYPKGITKLVSYLTPRTCRIDDDALVNFGLQGYIQEYLIEPFEKDFFAREENEVVEEYARILNATLGEGLYDLEKVRSLHRLGYLPLRISQVPEGMRVPLRCPMIRIENTHPDFAWLVNTIESSMSAYLWHMMVCASVGYKYRNIAKRYRDLTCDDDVQIARMLGDFSYRGQESPESATHASAAWLTSHLNTATVPAIMYLEDYYHADVDHGHVGYGAVSTEHSVMCSNFAIDGDEKTMLRRLLTEIYPKGYFTCVSDSYDFWNLVDNILPEIKDDILERDGCFAIRGDSGDPIDITCELVSHLWEIFGGHINAKGYKVLDPHVKAVYGDSITVQRCEAIYQRLEKSGFAANNVSLGVGSFSFECIEENGILKPFTRDTYGIAVKSTYCEVDGTPYQIFKDPKTDSGVKKSHRGLVNVYLDGDENIAYKDGYDKDNIENAYIQDGTLWKIYFENGAAIEYDTIDDVRQRLWDGAFYE